MFVFPSGLTASERSIRNTADGVPCPCREEHLVGVFLVETGSIVADQTFLSLFPASIETEAEYTFVKVGIVKLSELFTKCTVGGLEPLVGPWTSQARG